jgi:hypothetical protein
MHPSMVLADQYTHPYHHDDWQGNFAIVAIVAGILLIVCLITAVTHSRFGETRKFLLWSALFAVILIVSLVIFLPWHAHYVAPS